MGFYKRVTTFLSRYITSPAPSNLNYNYNFGIFAIFNSAIFGLLYFGNCNQFTYWSFYWYLTVTISYILLYIWRSLLITLSSFISFVINIFILSLFLFGFYNLFQGFPKPIYVEDLSLFSYYRYLTFLIVTVLGLLVYILFRNYPSMTPIIEWVNFPYLKEEVRLILATWNDTKFGPICSSIMDYSYVSKSFRYSFVVCHITTIYLVRILQSIFLLNFAFFEGDLRYCFYLVPFSFLSWILSFLEYYLKIFFEGSLLYLEDVLSVKFKNPLSKEELLASFIIRNKDELDFTITSEGYKEGFTDSTSLNYLSETWVKLRYIKNHYIFYINIIKYLSISYTFIRILSWSLITSPNIPFMLHAGFFDVLKSSSRAFSTSRPNLAPKQSFYVKKPYQKKLAQESENAYKPPHPIVADLTEKDEANNVKVYGQLTHGPGLKNNPSSVLSETEDPRGLNSKGQRIVVPSSECSINTAHLIPPMHPTKNNFLIMLA